MRHVLGLTGVVAASILLLVSAAMNWKFGYSLGKSEFESHLYGAASAAADCFKALLPFFIFAALRNKSWSQAAGGVILFAVCFAYSFASSLGFAALNRADTTGARTLHAESYQEMRAELAHARERLTKLGDTRPAGTVASDIEAMKNNSRWLSSAECTNATVAASMSYCESYHKLRAELAVSEEAAKLDARIKEVNARLAGVSGEAVVKEADPQSKILAELSGRSTEEVQLALTVLIAFLVELGASTGFYVAFSFWGIQDQTHRLVQRAPAPKSAAEPEPEVETLAPAPITPESPKSDVELFFSERVGKEEGSSVMALTLYDDYCAWCEARGKQPLGLPIFNRQFGDLGVQKAKIAGRIRWLGVRMLFGDEEETASGVTLASDNLRPPRSLMLARP
ncbi:MAG: hypothetical protein NW215_05910 [Hyphomicrobiales bacterium]|nr:hypothetical protein [Hyphomicrobiales bacterium]